MTRPPSRKSCPVIPTWCSSARPPPSARRSRTPDRPSSSSSRSCAEVNARYFLAPPPHSPPLPPAPSPPPPPSFFCSPGEQRFPGNSVDETASCLRSGSFLLGFLLCSVSMSPFSGLLTFSGSSIGLTVMQIHLIVPNTSDMCLLIFHNVITSFIPDSYWLCFLPSRVAADLQAYLLRAGQKQRFLMINKDSS